MTVNPFAGYQNEVYLNGLSGRRPQWPVGWREMEQLAYSVMRPESVGYVAGGAGAEETMRANREAFDRWRIVPRMMRAVAERDLTTTVLRTTLNSPLMLAPIGVTEIIHPDAERAVARAAAALGVGMVLSTAASTSMEDVAAELGDTPKWYQLYWPRDPEIAASFLRRAEASGYEAIVVTLDTWLLGWRPRDIDAAYLPFLHAQGVANYFSDPAFLGALAKPPAEDQLSAILHFVGNFSNASLTWDDLKFTREHTSLPVLVKGVLHPDDARRALDAGADGVIVSNHGGRQVDGAVAALDQLPLVAEAVGARVPVLFDSGVRSGADAIKALALGAEAVLLGRPYLHGLAVGGEAGVRHVLRAFLADLEVNLALAGHRTPGELDLDALAPRPT